MESMQQTNVVKVVDVTDVSNNDIDGTCVTDVTDDEDVLLIWYYESEYHYH